MKLSEAFAEYCSEHPKCFKCRLDIYAHAECILEWTDSHCELKKEQVVKEKDNG